MESEAQGQVGSQQPKYEEHENFDYWYANNIQFQATDTDLTMFFGELDLRGGPGITKIKQHTAMTVSWEQAKLMSYLLQVNIAGREVLNGKINIPSSLRPPAPNVPSEGVPEQQKAIAQKMYHAIKKLYDDFVASL